MLPRRALRHAVAIPSRAVGTAAALARPCVVHSDAKQDESSDGSGVSTHSALQRQQLEFCCLLCGWDVACSTCPFNWFNFDPRKFRTKQRRRPGDTDPRNLAASEVDVRQAMEILGIEASSTPMGGFDKVSITQQQVKDAFRSQGARVAPGLQPGPRG